MSRPGRATWDSCGTRSTAVSSSPGNRRTVLQVQSDQPPTYLRATVLDDFVDDAGRSGFPVLPTRSSPRLPTDRVIRQQVVTVNGLSDTHLVGGSVPIRFEAATGLRSSGSQGPGSRRCQNLPHGFRYTVWSYAPQPTPAACAARPRFTRRNSQTTVCWTSATA